MEEESARDGRAVIRSKEHRDHEMGSATLIAIGNCVSLLGDLKGGNAFFPSSGGLEV